VYVERQREREWIGDCTEEIRIGKPLRIIKTADRHSENTFFDKEEEEEEEGEGEQ